MMRSYLISALIGTFLMACSANKVPNMTPEETKHIDELTTNMTTRCIGRYLIDLPESFVLGWNPGAEIEGVTISVRPMSRETFEVLRKDRELELRAEHMDGRPDRPSLLAVTQFGGGAQSGGAVFNRAEATGSAEFARTLELIGWKDSYQIKMVVNATDGSNLQIDPKVIGTHWEAIEKETIEKYKTINETPKKLAHLLKLFESVRGRLVGDIPNERGLCIPNGFIPGGAVEQEGVSISFDLKGTPDVYFQFGEHGDLHEKTTLLERTSQTEKEMKVSGTQTIRKGKQTFHNLPYEEWLMKGPTPDRVPGTMFMLHGNEVAEGADKPFITLELFNGFRVMSPPDLSDVQKERLGLYKELERASLSEAEAVALWDKIVPSFRPRPGAF